MGQRRGPGGRKEGNRRKEEGARGEGAHGRKEGSRSVGGGQRGVQGGGKEGRRGAEAWEEGAALAAPPRPPGHCAPARSSAEFLPPLPGEGSGAGARGRAGTQWPAGDRAQGGAARARGSGWPPPPTPAQQLRLPSPPPNGLRGPRAAGSLQGGGAIVPRAAGRAPRSSRCGRKGENSQLTRCRPDCFTREYTLFTKLLER